MCTRDGNYIQFNLPFHDKEMTRTYENQLGISRRTLILIKSVIKEASYASIEIFCKILSMQEGLKAENG